MTSKEVYLIFHSIGFYKNVKIILYHGLDETSPQSLITFLKTYTRLYKRQNKHLNIYLELSYNSFLFSEDYYFKTEWDKLIRTLPKLDYLLFGSDYYDGHETFKRVYNTYLKNFKTEELDYILNKNGKLFLEKLHGNTLSPKKASHKLNNKQFYLSFKRFVKNLSQ